MSWPAWLFVATSLAGWLAFALSRRRHARELRRLAIEHKDELTKATMRGKLDGAKAAREALGQDWQEASTLSNAVNPRQL